MWKSHFTGKKIDTQNHCSVLLTSVSSEQNETWHNEAIDDKFFLRSQVLLMKLCQEARSTESFSFLVHKELQITLFLFSILSESFDLDGYDVPEKVFEHSFQNKSWWNYMMIKTTLE